MLDHAAMMRELENWDYTFGTTDPTGEVYLPGTWDQIERAGDLLSDEDYRHLLQVTAARREAAGRA
ncbi:hypothetical protein ACFQZK_00925 [Rhodococcus aetherivorans]